MSERSAAELSGDLPGANCPFCGTFSAEHESADCLDRWIHQEFFRNVVASDDPVPPYSRSPQHPCLNDLIEAPRWVEGTAVMQTMAGCSVGILVRREGAYGHYKIVATGASLPLAVCRAAVCGVACGGAATLEIK